MAIELPEVPKHDEDAARNRLNMMIAVSVAIISAFLAVSKVKDDNIVQAMQQAQAYEVDTWNEYQSKRIREYQAESSLNNAQALRAVMSTGNTAPIDQQIRRYGTDVPRYKQDLQDLKKKAEGFHEQYDKLNFKDDQFDMSDATLSLSLATLAVTALTAQRWLLWFSWILATFGLLMGTGGLAGLPWHPDWLVKLLS